MIGSRLGETDDGDDVALVAYLGSTTTTIGPIEFRTAPLGI